MVRASRDCETGAADGGADEALPGTLDECETCVAQCAHEIAGDQDRLRTETIEQRTRRERDHRRRAHDRRQHQPCGRRREAADLVQVDDLERKDQSSAELVDGGPGLTNDDRPRQARPPIGEHTCNRPAHDLPLLISRCIGARSRRERPSRRPVQIRPPNIGTRLAAAACGSCVTRRARRIVCIWAASRCRSSMRAVASARLRWCIGPPITTRICLSRVLTRPAGETRRRISSISGVAVGVSRDARLRS